MDEISELQKKRAVNLIWSGAQDHSFTPDFKVFDRDGTADLYFNLIIGAVRRHYDYPQLEKLFLSLRQYEDSDSYEELMWLGLENCVFIRECADRPVLASLRQSYARDFLRGYPPDDGFHPERTLLRAHFERVLGQTPALDAYAQKLLGELEFPAELNTEQLIAAAERLFGQWFQLSTELKKKRSRSELFPVLFHRAGREGSRRYGKFGFGFAERPANIYGGSTVGAQDEATVRKTKMSAAELRLFMETKFGKPVLSSKETGAIERELCRGNHSGCHLHFTAGELQSGKINNGFEALQREREQKQRQRNRDAFNANLASNHVVIDRLTSKIRNSVLMRLYPDRIKSNFGEINAGAVWRALELDDERVFTRLDQSDLGELSVDLLLDASTSQKHRQETVSAQGYIIAESLSRCGIPCRVMSFCSMTGYTIMHLFRDYTQRDKNSRIFDFVANGCNRDGLAIKAAHHLISRTPYEHKLLIVLSDVKPNDVIRLPGAGEDARTFYEQQAGVNDTALEVRRARADGISVVCVFTGADEDVQAAKTVYGRDFTRIQTLDKLAEAVGMLIQNQIKNI